MSIAQDLQVMKLLNDIRVYDKSTWQHSVRVNDLAVRVGKKLGLDEDYMYKLYAAALLHDYGKIFIPKILLASSHRFSKSERCVAEAHVELGLQALRNEEAIDDTTILMISEHHERIDGSGYPKGVSNLCIGGKILGVVDVFDAVTHKRSYKGACSCGYAIKILRNDGGIKFDKEIITIVEDLLANGYDSDACINFDSTENKYLCCSDEWRE